MKLSFAHAHGLAALILAALAFGANAAGQNKPLPDPADASAPVPPTRYEPFLVKTPAPRTSSPADNWKALNRTVATYDSMSLTMDMAEPKPAEPAPAAEAAAAGPETKSLPAAAPKSQPDPHAHHRPGAGK